MASIYDKVLAHSYPLRRGMAESLALIGSHPEALKSCSTGKAKETAVLAIHEILYDKCPFETLFEQEGSGIVGRNYMTGLLWALETLAWDADYLIRVVVILGELAEKDHGGNWSNRPANSLSTIFFSWFPQTCAPVPKRKAAVSVLIKEHPEIAWNLLLSLLPESHQISHWSRKHLEVGLSRLGQVLINIPIDPDGFWINHSAARVLNSKDNKKIRDGFFTGMINARGVHFGTAGDGERKLAAKYRERAEETEGYGHHRLASTIKKLAASYERDAEKEASKDLYD